MNNLRKHYDNYNQVSSTPATGDMMSLGGPAGQARQPIPTQAKYPGDRGLSNGTVGSGLRSTTPTPRAGPPDYNAPLPKPLPSADLLPGTMNSERPPPRPEPPRMTSMSTTELYKDEAVQQTSNGERRSLPSSEFSRANMRAHGSRDNNPGATRYGPGQQATSVRTPAGIGQSPAVSVQAWQPSSQKNPPNTSGSPSVDPRFHQHGQPSHNYTHGRNVPNSSGSGVVNGAYTYDDGEIMVPPKPRENTQKDIRDQGKYPYVPSKPSDRPPEGTRNVGPMSSLQDPGPSRKPSTHSYAGGAPPPHYFPPPQYRQALASHPAAVESRDKPTNNGLQGPTQSHTQPPSHGQPPLSNTNSASPAQRGMENSYNSYGRQNLQPVSNGRTSPQGQSSTPASQSPNHDKSTPSPYGPRHFGGAKHGLESHMGKQDIRNDSHSSWNSPGQKGSTDVNSPHKNNVYSGASLAKTTENNHAPLNSPYVKRSASPNVRQGHSLYSDKNQMQNTSKIMDNNQRTDTKALQSDQLYHSPENVRRTQRSKSPAPNHRPEMTKHDQIPLQTLSNPRPSSRGPTVQDNAQWKGPQQTSTNQWNARPASRASADQWEDSDDSSMTPPLPALSNTPPGTPSLSPIKVMPAESTSARYPMYSAKGSAQKRRPKKSGTVRVDSGWRKPAAGRNLYKSPGQLVASRNHQDELDSPDNGSTTNVSGDEEWNDTVDKTELRQMRRQMEGLEVMYAEILKTVGMDKEYMPGSRASISSVSTASRLGGGRRSRGTVSSHKVSREIRHMNKRFTRLESHVVTLARSVAHLSSEMRTQNALYQELEDLKKDVRHLKKERNHGTHGNHSLLPVGATDDTVLGPDGKPIPDWERFRGWIPSIQNPKRVKKLAKFFGQDRLLYYFLERLGYTKYAKNFDAEEITILELPYMNEERLEKLGIPMGPRQRILQEAQQCFRHENFSIYIV